MDLLAVTLFELSLSLHITAVVVGLGATFAEAVTFPVAMRLSVRHLPYVHQLQLTINSRLTSPALLVVLLTGFYQVAEGNWNLGEPWISASFLIVIVLGGLVGAYFIPTDRRLGAMVEAEIAAAGDGEPQLSDEYLRAGRREGAIGALAGVLIVIAVFLMVIKPGA